MKIIIRTLLASSLVSAALLLTGCAAHENNYVDVHNSMNAETLTVTTGKIKGASCVLRNNKGHWKVTGTPQKVKIVRDYSDLRIRCQANGYLFGQRTLRAEEFPFSQAYPRVINIKLHEKGS